MKRIDLLATGLILLCVLGCVNPSKSIVNKPVPPKAVTSDQAVAICNRIAKELALKWNEKHAIATKQTIHGIGQDSVRWNVISGSSSFVLDDETGKVIQYTDKSRHDKHPHPTAIVPTEPDELWQIADRVRDKVAPAGLEHWQIGFGDMTKTTEIVERSVLSYQTKPNGYDSNGMGNSLAVTIDKIDDSIISFTVSFGWTYDAANVKITKEDAIKRAGKACKAPTRHAVANLSYVASNGAFGSEKGPSLQAEKHCRLCYVVTLGNHYIYIDAETGDCLGGAKITSMPAEIQREASLPRGIPSR